MILCCQIRRPVVVLSTKRINRTTQLFAHGERSTAEYQRNQQVVGEIVGTPSVDRHVEKFLVVGRNNI